MKIKKLIKILDCIEGDYKGKIKQDMYDRKTYLAEYYIRTGSQNGEFIKLNDLEENCRKLRNQNKITKTR